MSDVVSRLLAAIDEREAKANRLVGEDWFAVPEVYLSEAYAQHAAMHGAKSVLRLCQAHRDIVDEWKRNKQIADQLQHEVPQGEAYLVAKGIVAGLWASVVLVACGYGVEDGEDR